MLKHYASWRVFMAHPVVEGFRKEWPSAFAGPSLDELSGKAVRWATTQNRRSRGEIPPECFVEGRPTIVLRDPFLAWLDEKLSKPSPPIGGSAERLRTRRRRSSRPQRAPAVG